MTRAGDTLIGSQEQVIAVHYSQDGSEIILANHPRGLARPQYDGAGYSVFILTPARARGTEVGIATHRFYSQSRIDANREFERRVCSRRPHPDPEMERLLAEEEEIERRSRLGGVFAEQKAAQMPNVDDMSAAELKDYFIEQTMAYPQGCDLGKRTFLRDLGLDNELHGSVYGGTTTVQIEMNEANNFVDVDVLRPALHQALSDMSLMRENYKLTIEHTP